VISGLLNELYFYLTGNWLGLLATLYVLSELMYLVLRPAATKDAGSSDS
jgi:hypothetical protein